MPKFKIKGRKETFEPSYKLSEMEDKKPKLAKIKVGKMSDIKPMKEGKIIIRRKSKREGKYVKDEQYYKAKILNPNTSAADSEKYYKLMKKVMGNK